jgi:putative flippase GtrA
MKRTLTLVIDAFYFPFRSWLPLKTYRYAVCGGGNLALDIILYFIFYNFIFVKSNVDLGLFVMSPHIASLFIVFPITFTTGFTLNKYITFEESNLPGQIQFVRYFLVAMGAMLISYVLMKIMVDWFQFFPTPSRFITILITVVYSYIMQNRFSFKVV